MLTARQEMMHDALVIAKDYLTVHKDLSQQDAFKIAYADRRQEMIEETLRMKFQVAGCPGMYDPSFIDPSEYETWNQDEQGAYEFGEDE